MDYTSRAAIVNLTEQIFDDGGENGRLLADIDWALTPLGPVESWPTSLRLSLQLCLASRHPFLIWWGPQFIKLYNDAYSPMLGKRHPWALGKPGREVWPEIWDIIGPMLESVLLTGKATWSDDQLLPLERNGYQEEAYFTFSYSPIPDESGQVAGILTVVSETTEQVLNARRGYFARELAAALIDARSSTETAIIDAAMRVVGNDPADIPFALLYRVDEEQQYAQLLHSVGIREGTTLSPTMVNLNEKHIIWPFTEVVQNNAARIVASLPTESVEFSVEAALIPHTALVLPITEPGQTVPTLLLLVGVSPQRKLDEDYRAWYDLLVSHLATALAAAHAYETERRKAEALADIDRAKTAFFSNVSHEFRTPLTLMLSPLAELLDDGVGSLHPEQRMQLEMLQRNGLRLMKLVNTLLDFTRIEAGRVEASYVATDLSAFTADIASTFRSLIEKAGLDFEVQCKHLPDLVYVDRDMWEKIVLNLLSNAFKFTFEGNITVELHAAEGAAELVVRDTGTGIPADEVPRLFERFHRVEGARARTHEGSGIGLALVQELVHLHGGTITLQSTEGVGSIVQVRIPFGVRHLPADRINATSSLDPTTMGAEVFVEEARRWLLGADIGPATPTLSTISHSASVARSYTNARILLVDDNADMREYLTRILETRYQVKSVANGTQALVAIEHELPALVLTDVMMPELDGFGLLRALRANPATTGIPVLMLSARAGEEATIEGLQAGADDYLIKPFSSRELLARVDAHLEMARLRQEAQARVRELEATFATMADGMAIYDAMGNLVEWNTKLATMFEFERVTAFATLSAGERQAHMKVRDTQNQLIPLEQLPFMRALRGEELTDDRAMDFQVTLASGRDLHVSASAAPLRDPSGQCIGAVASFRDVTARHSLENEARENAERLRAILELLPVGVALVDAQGKAILVNRAIYDIWGTQIPWSTSRADFGKYKAWWPETGQPVAAEEWGLARALTTGEASYAREIYIETFDGARKTILDSNAPLRDETGAIIGAMSIILDITERKRLEQHTQQSLAALLDLTESLVDVAPSTTDAEPLHLIGERLVTMIRRVFACDMVALVRIERATNKIQPVAVVGLEPAAEKHWSADLPGTILRDYLAPDVVERLLAGASVEVDVAAHPFPIGIDYGLQEIIAAPLLLGDEVVGAMAIEYRQSPRQLIANDEGVLLAMGRLSALAIERDRLLREQTAAQAREMALQESSQRMNEFLGIASHELRTPLTSIMANIQMSERLTRNLETIMEDETIQRPVAKLHLMMQRSNHQLLRLNRLVGDLVDISRISAGKLDLRPEECDLLAVVRDCVEAQHEAWPERQINLNMPRQEKILVVADADRIGQVLTNYLTNALKYAPPPSSVTVRVFLQAGQVRVAVRDKGPGLSREQQEHLFERFYRVPGMIQHGSGVGLGLGLYICKTIIERHGGTLGVRSQPGNGATFWFSLPCRSDDLVEHSE
jgi:PAS domain S-box-containing protein